MANALTVLRLLAAGPTTWLLVHPDSGPDGLLAVLVALAVLTDVLDGRVARARGTASDRGRLYDHGTDFLYVTSGLAGAASAGLVTPVLPVLITVAFTQYVLDSYFLHRQKRLRMSTLGRWNGILYFVPLVGFAAARVAPAGPADLLNRTATAIGYLLVVTTALSIVDRLASPRAQPEEESTRSEA